MSEERLKDIDKRLMRVGLLDLPGWVLFGLGLYGTFNDDAGSFLPFLNNSFVVNAMMGVGIAIMAWGVVQVVKLSVEKSKLMRDQ